MPITHEEIADFLAQSSKAYKPLDQLPISRIVHHRKSSFSGVRLFTSPYGLPLPRPPQASRPKTSLITKFERTNSSSSSNVSFGGEDPPIFAPPAPLSAVFAEFTRERPLSPSPKLVVLPSLDLLELTKFDAVELQKQEEEAESDCKAGSKRPRVSPDARRQALGWGRRRYSERPSKTQKTAPKTEEHPLTAIKAKRSIHGSAVQDKENVQLAS